MLAQRMTQAVATPMKICRVRLALILWRHADDNQRELDIGTGNDVPSRDNPQASPYRIFPGIESSPFARKMTARPRLHRHLQDISLLLLRRPCVKDFNVQGRDAPFILRIADNL